MSSSDTASAGFRPLRALLAAGAMALALAGCTVQPLYGTAPTGLTVTAALDQITIAPVDTRVAQEIRNKLLFELGGGRNSAPLYRMNLRVSSSESALGVTPVESAPTYSITVAATYEITSLTTGEIVLRGTSRGIASFDRTSQIYANTRAKIDAENRAATDAATDIRIRLAAAAAKGVI